MAEALLEVADLAVGFRGSAGVTEVLNGVSFAVAPGEIVGVVGESGSGKSVTALAILRLLGATGVILRGRIAFEGRDLAKLGEREMLGVRGRSIGMVFQEPMTCLNPLFRVGYQLGEVLTQHLGLAGAELRENVEALLAGVGIPAPAERARSYPHELSGGLRQRVMLAMAMACGPQLLIADEPTTALDVTIQAQILDLLLETRQRTGTAILLITHDMGVIARMAERVLVMYAGEIVEDAPARTLFERAGHPYTRALLASSLTVARRAGRLPAIPGTLPAPNALPAGCRFHPRCAMAVQACREAEPTPVDLGPRHRARCFRAVEVAAGARPAVEAAR